MRLLIFLWLPVLSNGQFEYNGFSYNLPLVEEPFPPKVYTYQRWDASSVVAFADTIEQQAQDAQAILDCFRNGARSEDQLNFADETSLPLQIYQFYNSCGGLVFHTRLELDAWTQLLGQVDELPYNISANYTAFESAWRPAGTLDTTFLDLTPPEEDGEEDCDSNTPAEFLLPMSPAFCSFDSSGEPNTLPPPDFPTTTTTSTSTTTTTTTSTTTTSTTTTTPTTPTTTTTKERGCRGSKSSSDSKSSSSSKSSKGSKSGKGNKSSGSKGKPGKKGGRNGKKDKKGRRG